LIGPGHKRVSGVEGGGRMAVVERVRFRVARVDSPEVLMSNRILAIRSGVREGLHMAGAGLTGATMKIPGSVVAALVLVLLTAIPAVGRTSPSLVPTDSNQVTAEETAQQLLSRLGGKLGGSLAGKAIAVQSLQTSRRAYYLVPINNHGRTIGLVGMSGDGRSWQWYTDSYRGLRFPAVSARRAEEIMGSRSVGRAVLVLAPDRKLYWTTREEGTRLVSIEDDRDVRTLEQLQSPSRADVKSGEQTRLPTSDTLGDSTDSPYSVAATSSLPTSKNLSVPHYYQVNFYYCGPAVLQMLFDLYNPLVKSQYDIGAAMNAKSSGPSPDYPGAPNSDLLRAAHFSSLSRAIQNTALQGYSERSIGYEAIGNAWSRNGVDDPDYPMRYSDLKRLIASGYPIVLTTWYDGTHANTHFRLLKGYDDSTGEFIVHDPWYQAPYYGPNVHFNQKFLVDDLWTSEHRWAALIRPWKVTVTAPSTATAGVPFTVTGRVDYPGPHPFERKGTVTQSSVTLQVPSGFRVGTATRPLSYITRSANGQTVSWTVTPPSTYSGKARLRVLARGKFKGSSRSYPSYTDWIGGTGVRVVSVTR
ncbi:MAG: C39 family peptidase, partial [Chloroflexota bacterium]|nr:C39 family peptidase [Chloroflexota bacterium]